MKRFVLKAVLFVVIGIAGMAVLCFISNHTYPEAQIFREVLLKNYLADHMDEVDTLSAGSSYGCALHLETMGYDGCDIWQLGMDIFETRVQLETYVPKLPKLKTVFLGVGYTLFHGDNGVYNLEGRAPRRRLFYAINPSFKVIPGDMANFNFIKGKMLPITRRDHWRSVYQSLFKPDVIKNVNKGSPSYLPHMLRRRSMKQIKSPRKLAIMAKRGAFPYSQKKQKEMMKNHPRIHDDTYNTFVDIINYLNSKNIRLVCYSAPQYKAYADIQKERNHKTVSFMKNAMKRLVEEHGLEYYDFSEDPDLYDKHRLFFDCDHMNRRGARLFSMKLKKAMAETENKE